MAAKGTSRDKLLNLIGELRSSPATIFELSAATGMTKNTVEAYLKRFRAAGFVAFHSFDVNGKPGRRGYRASKWVWQ